MALPHIIWGVKGVNERALRNSSVRNLSDVLIAEHLSFHGLAANLSWSSVPP